MNKKSSRRWKRKGVWREGEKEDDRKFRRKRVRELENLWWPAARGEIV